MTTPNRLLDLDPSVGQRSESIEWILHSRTGKPIGEIHPSRDSGVVPTMQVSTNASIIRTVQSLVIDRRELGSINPFTDRVRPWWVLEDGSRWPLGELLFTDNPEAISTGPTVSSTTLFDGLFSLDVETDRSFGVEPKASIEAAIRSVLDINGVWNSKVTTTGAVSGASAQAWPIGSNWRDILKQLCALAGFLPPYCDNDGVLVCRPQPQVAIGTGHHVYDEKNSRILAGTGIRNANLLTAPNAFIVVGTGATDGDVSAIAYVDPHEPHSKENIGRLRPKTYMETGVADTAAAQQMANAYASASSNTYELVQFSSAPDPRHDVFDLIDFLGTTYVETQWSLALEPGGEMRHTCGKTIAV